MQSAHAAPKSESRAHIVSVEKVGLRKPAPVILEPACERCRRPRLRVGGGPGRPDARVEEAAAGAGDRLHVES
eukprot:2704868-Prymnesium_polylepis.2